LVLQGNMKSKNFLLSRENLLGYLAAQNLVEDAKDCVVRELGGGVSNIVLLVEWPGEPERRARRQREHEGIALPEPVWQELAGVAKRFDVLLPASL